MAATEGKCKDCEYAIFCPSFGEYKCVLYGKIVYFPSLTRSCFAKSKSDVLARECHCETCMQKGYIEDEEID